jgi:UDP-2,3-diacylglucosamine pyrophosphatase LpxH
MKTVKQEVYLVGDSVEMLCSACDVEQNHLVETATKHGRITKAICEVCSTSSTFSRGVKTSVAMGGSKTATPYDRTRKYRKGQAMMHSKFGQGEVMAVIDPQKIDVLFGDQTRRLIHAQV